MAQTEVGIRLSVSGDAQVRGALGGVERSLESVGSAVKAAIGPMALMYATVQGIGKLVSVQREFDALNSSLKTVTGSSAAAAKEMEWIKQFAKETPFGLAQATQGFVKMKALGLDPSRAALTSFGNTASAMGKDLNQMIEAVADAATGEFERLKEFGIKSKKEGDSVSFTFQGVTTKIGNNAAEINAYLESLGNNQFAGAMAERANTLDGAIASLGDTWEELFRTVSAQGTGNLIHDTVRLAEGAVTDLTAVIAALNSATADNASQAGAMATVQEGLATAFEAVAVLGVNVAYTLKAVGNELGGLAAQAAAVATGQFAQAAEIGRLMRADAEKARAEVDATTARILAARKVAALGQLNDYDEPSVIRARAAAQAAASAAKITAAKAEAAATAAAAAQEKAREAAAKAAAADAKKAAEAELDYRRRTTLEYIKLWEDQAKAELAYQAALDERKFDEAWAADQKSLELAEARIKLGRTTLEQIEFETSLLALNTTEREVATAMRELERQGVVKGTEAYAAYAEKIQQAIRTREGKNAETKAADEAAKAWQKTSDKIEQDLTDALMRGFESGKGFAENLRDTVANMFKTLVLRPVVQAIVQPVAGSITSALGMGGQGGAMGAINTASSLYSAYGAAGTAGGFVGSLGSAASYGTAIGSQQGAMLAAQEMGMGTLAGSAGSIGAALPWIGAGLAVLSLIDSLDDSGTPHTGGMAAYSRAGGAAVGDAAKAQGLGFNLSSNDYQASTEQASAQLAQAIVGMLDSTAQTFGREAGYWAATGFADDVSSDGSWAALAIKMGDALLVDWKDGADKWPGREFADGEAGARQYAAAVALDVRNLLLEQTPGWADTMLNALGDAPSIEQLGAVVGQINMVQNALVGMGRASEAFAAMGEQATTALIAAMGGADAAVAGLSGYYTNFYTEAERAEMATASLTADFAALGQELPASRLGLRAMIDAAIEAGDPALAGKLVNLSGRFAALVPTAEEAAAAMAKAADAAKAAADAAISQAKASTEAAAQQVVELYQAFRADSTVLEVRLLQLAGKSQEALSLQREAEIAAVDATLQPIMRRVYALEDEKAALETVNSAYNSATKSIAAFAGNIKNFVASLLGRQGAVSASVAYRADLRLAATGNADAMANVTTSAGAYLAEAKGKATSAQDYARTVATVAAELTRLPDQVRPEALIAQAIADSADRQLSAAESAKVAQLAQLQALVASTGKAVTFAQFSAATQGSNAELRKIFDAIDTNGDGTISALEAVNASTGVVGSNTAGIESEAQKQLNYLNALNESTKTNVSSMVTLNATMVTLKDAIYALGVTQAEQARLEKERLINDYQGQGKTLAAQLATDPIAQEFLQKYATTLTEATRIEVDNKKYIDKYGRDSWAVGVEGYVARLQQEAGQYLASAAQRSAELFVPIQTLRDQIKALGGVPAFAQGAAFTNGIVTRPTLFNMGLMGEEDPEAIMPLTRMPGGDLGVQVRMPAAPDWSQYGRSSDAALVAEIQALRAEVQGLRAEARATAINTGRTEQLIKRVTRNGEAMQTEAAT